MSEASLKKKMSESGAGRVSFDDVPDGVDHEDIESKGSGLAAGEEASTDHIVSEDESSAATPARDNSAALVEAHQNERSRRESLILEEVKILQLAKTIGGQYTRHEFAFVLTVGIVLSFNAGYVNGACLSGLLTANGMQQSVAGFTGSYTNGALALAGGQLDIFGRQSCMILSFITGSCISGLLTPDAVAHRLEPTYGPTFLLGGAFLIIASVLAAINEQFYFFYFAAAANGIQNGISSLYSANLIRSTHLTGTSTDIGLFLGQVMRGRTKNLWKLVVLIALALSFWIGGFVSFFATRAATQYSLLFNAFLYICIGTALVIFLMNELKVSVSAALVGSWMWQRVFDQLEKVLRANIDHLSDDDDDDDDGDIVKRPSSITRSQRFADYFDTLHQSHGLKEGLLDGDTLFRSLQDAGVKITRKEVNVLIEKADEDGNDLLSKEEWIKIARRANARRSTSK